MVETEMNELVSDFLGLRYKCGYHTVPIIGGGSSKILEYNHNWNWLIPAWIKFRDLRFEEPRHQFGHSDFKSQISHRICYGTISSAFESLVNAIQWYNSITII